MCSCDLPTEPFTHISSPTPYPTPQPNHWLWNALFLNHSLTACDLSITTTASAWYLRPLVPWAHNSFIQLPTESQTHAHHWRYSPEFHRHHCAHRSLSASACLLFQLPPTFSSPTFSAHPLPSLQSQPAFCLVPAVSIPSVLHFCLP